ncbi:MAG TPA: PEP-CTERM sorting domain-containing protein [Thiobacillus sp.]
MNNTIKKVGLGVILAGLSVAPAVHATLLTTDPGTGTTTVFTTTGNQGFGNSGPVTLDGFSWSGNPQITYGNAGYGLSSNGNWSFSWIATNNGNGSITVDLGGDYDFVGGFMNYAPNSGGPATITALAADGVTVLESYDLSALAPISTPGQTNGGAFRGISRTQGDIRFFQLSNDFIIIHSLEIGQSVPEPATLALFGLGLFGLGFSRYKKA